MNSLERIIKITSRQRFQNLEDKIIPKVTRSFLEAVHAMRSELKMKELIKLIEAKDFDAVVDLAIESKKVFKALDDRIRGQGVPLDRSSVYDDLLEAHMGGAQVGAYKLGRLGRATSSLDLTNPASTRYLRDHLPEMIVEIDNQQRVAVREALLRGYTDGRPAPMIAREIRDSVGLTAKQSTYVANFRRQLETGQMGSGTAPWARRLSAVEQNQARVIFSSPTASTAKIDAMVTRYSESLLNRRAKNIARTEVHRSAMEGQNALWDQAKAEGLLDPERTKRFWLFTHDGRGRDEHAAVPKMNEDGVGLDEDFQTPIGPVSAPGESGDAGFDINCRCDVIIRFSDK